MTSDIDDKCFKIVYRQHLNQSVPKGDEHNILILTNNRIKVINKGFYIVLIVFVRIMALP